MARINLLPWREQQREERKQRFLVSLGGVAVVAVGLLSLADQYFTHAIEQFDEMRRASEKYAQVFVVSLHSFIAGQPYRLKHLRRLLQHIKAHEAETWITKPGEVAAHYRNLPAN